MQLEVRLTQDYRIGGKSTHRSQVSMGLSWQVWVCQDRGRRTESSTGNRNAREIEFCTTIYSHNSSKA